MVKRISVLGLLLAMALFCGCAQFFQREYLSITEYTDEQHGDLSGEGIDVTTYSEFRAALNRMVENHVEEEYIRFSNYTNSAGVDISNLSEISREILSDFAQIDREIKDETALGSFAVDRITADPVGRVVTFYEVTVRVQYKRTAEEIAAIRSVFSSDRLSGFFSEALADLDAYVAFRYNAAELTNEDIISAVNAAFEDDPASCVLAPGLEVQIHPASTAIGRIIEVEFDFNRSNAAILNLRDELNQAIADYSLSLNAENDQSYAMDAYNMLAARVSYDPDNTQRADSGLDRAFGSSVYGALVESLSDSRGIALAFSTLCHERGIECLVVTGTFDKAEHSWNIVKLGESYYHVDVTADSTLGITAAFGASDSQMIGNYWWNIADYPVCESPLVTEEPPVQ
jgi:hypothetical protein